MSDYIRSYVHIYKICAKNILKHGYSWRAGSGSSSFWFGNRSSHGPVGNHVHIIDIYDLHLSVKNVFSTNGNCTQALYTNLPSTIVDYINNTNNQFNATLEDAFSFGVEGRWKLFREGRKDGGWRESDMGLVLDGGSSFSFGSRRESVMVF